MEKVSVIIAVYNSEPFINKMVDSVINQTYRNLEIILVDDGSPDNCPSICDEYAKKDDRVLVIHKKNGGACEARNVGLEKASGTYVSIIDGDDWLEVDYIEYLMSLIYTTNAEMAMTDHIFTTRDREQVKKDEIEIWTNEEAATAIIYPRIAIGPWNKLYKLSLLRENNISFSVPWSGEGLYFSCMAAQYANKVAVGHKKIYNYRLNNAGSGLTNYKLEMGTNALGNIKNIGEVSIIKTNKYMNAVKWHIWKNYNFILFLLIATNSRNENQELYQDCLKNIRNKLLYLVIHTEFGPKTKLKMLFKGIFPVYCAKKELNKAKKEFKNDNME